MSVPTKFPPPAPASRTTSLVTNPKGFGDLVTNGWLA
jgi:hypothetical protein